MATKSLYFDGTKAIPLNALPEEAWTVIRGELDSDSDAIKFYKAVGVLHRCVNIRASAILRVPWEMRHIKGDAVVWDSEAEDVPDELLFAQNLPDLLGRTEKGLILTAKSFWIKDRNRGKFVKDLRWLTPTTVTPQWDKDRGLVGYERKLGKDVITLGLDEVVYFSYSGLHETQEDTPPAEAAMSAAGVIYNMDAFAEMFFKRGAVKATVLTVEGNPIESEREKLKAWWRRAFEGIKNAFNTEVFSGVLKPVVVGEGLQELSNTDLTGDKREAIATTLGVPHSKVFSNAANYATSLQDDTAFYNETIIPDCKIIERVVNRQLFGPLGYRFRFQPDAMDIYQEDETKRAQSYKYYVDAKMKPSIAAQILGIDLPDGVEYEDLDPEPQPVALQPAQPGQPQPGNEQPAQGGQPEREPMAGSTRAVEVARFKRWAGKRKAPDPAKFSSDVLSEADKAMILSEMGAATEQDFFTLTLMDGPITPEWVKAMLLKLDDDGEDQDRELRMALERRATRDIRQAFREMVDTLFPEGYGEWADPQLEALAIQRRFLEEQQLRDALSRALQDGVDLGVSVTVNRLEGMLGLGFDYTLASVQAREWALRYTDEVLGALARTTHDGVGQAIARWVESGESLDILINDLTPLFGPKRAELIASTEVSRAYARGALESFKQSQVVQEWQWQTANDELRCPICRGLHGKRAPLGEAFEGGYIFPAHPRCRCYPLAVIA